MNVLILQPPLVQLNTPYPSGAYLSAFFRELQNLRSGALAEEVPNQLFSAIQNLEQIESVRWIDAGNLLFREIFCAAGLKKLFAASEERALELAQTAEKNGDDATAFNLRRYVAQQDSWIMRINHVQAILCGGAGAQQPGGREFCHEFVRSAHMMRGKRMERFFAESFGEVTPDSAKTLATLALEDLCDYITAVYDPCFEPVRYAASLAESRSSFSAIEKALSFPVITDFLNPLLERVLSPLTALNGEWLACVSVPFPGTLAGALACCSVVKRLFAERVLTLAGGGYINTELRGLAERAPDCGLFSYADRLVYDRGYGALLGLLEQTAQKGFAAVQSDKRRILPDAAQAGFTQAEDFFTRTLVPDYGDIDFSHYPRLADTANPMHRLWADGAWLKTYLAHGCYWHRCFFCDTTLDYVKNYCAVQTERLFEGISQQADKKGVFGIHFVDEAAPPRSLVRFAVLNRARRSERPLTFWGNIRFEKAFSRHTADLLAYGGLTGVTGGIEIAALGGLQSVAKGIDIQSLTAVCAAFKEAGILVHAYMIFGYWEETPQMLIDSMETLRQFFEKGLLDSAFWHKFVLTRHSRLYDEWKSGQHTELKPEPQAKKYFADNDLRFAAEKDSQKYEAPLDSALHSWMRGEKLRVNVQKWFPFPMPKPSIPADHIEKHIAAYEKKRNAENTACAAYFQAADNPGSQNGKQLYWLAGKPIVCVKKNERAIIRWFYMDEEHSAVVSEKAAAQIARALYNLRPETAVGENSEANRKKNVNILRRHNFDANFFAGRGLALV